MNQSDTALLVDETIQRLLETWGMMSVEPTRHDLAVFDAGQPIVVSKIQYTGPFCGSFTLLMQPPFMEALAHNLVGDDAAIPESTMVEGARELTNRLSGSILGELFGNARAFSLLEPSISVTEYSTASCQRLPHLTCFKADGCPLALTYTVGE